MTIYERIKSRREELGLSQQQLADKLGYKSRSAINKIESGLRDINQSKITAFAKALNTTPAYLMGWEEKEPVKEDDELYKENVKLFSQLSEEKQEQVLAFLRFLNGE